MEATASNLEATASSLLVVWFPFQTGALRMILSWCDSFGITKWFRTRNSCIHQFIPKCPTVFWCCDMLSCALVHCDAVCTAGLCLLLRASASVDAVTLEEAFTSLHMAATNGWVEVVMQLIHAQALVGRFVFLAGSSLIK